MKLDQLPPSRNNSRPSIVRKYLDNGGADVFQPRAVVETFAGRSVPWPIPLQKLC